MYLTFGSSMTSFKVTKNSMRINGKDYEMKTVYGMSGKEEGNDNVCLVCLDNQKNKKENQSDIGLPYVGEPNKD